MQLQYQPEEQQNKYKNESSGGRTSPDLPKEISKPEGFETPEIEEQRSEEELETKLSVKSEAENTHDLDKLVSRFSRQTYLMGYVSIASYFISYFVIMMLLPNWLSTIPFISSITYWINHVPILKDILPFIV